MTYMRMILQERQNKDAQPRCYCKSALIREPLYFKAYFRAFDEEAEETPAVLIAIKG